MSFLNSVLSSLGDKKLDSAPLRVENAKPTSTPTNGKRKAESELTRPLDKASKIKTPKTDALTNFKASARPPTVNTNSSSSLSRSTTKPRVTTPAAAEAKAPKKGSYAEIMARAKQAPVIAPVGTITHKPKEKLSSKKELALAKEIAMKNKKRTNGKESKLALRSKSSSPGPSKLASRSKPNGKVPSAKPMGYSGTAKPKPIIEYKGTMKALPGEEPMRKRDHSEPGRSQPKSGASARRRKYYSEDDLDDEDEGYAYNSEDYSDMDAGFDDVEDEDERAEREAKKEDNYEKMMLEELKRQKEAKKKRLEQLAAKHKTHNY